MYLDSRFVLQNSAMIDACCIYINRIATPILAALLISSLFSCHTRIESKYNLSFEQVEKINDTLHPLGWQIPEGNATHAVNIDSTVKQEGRYSLRFTKNARDINAIVSVKEIAPPLAGKTLRLSGYIKSEDVLDGFAGLWIRADDENQNVLAFNNMYDKGISGTNDWQKYSVEIPLDPARAERISFGALFAGSGKIWVDNLQLTIDDTLITDVPLKTIFKKKDTSFNLSGIAPPKITPDKIKQLTNLGMLWGFLKYYHPRVAAGDYNWDKELFRMLPKVFSASSKDEFNSEMEIWVDELGAVQDCRDCNVLDRSKIKLMPSFGYLFNDGNLTSSLISRLAKIRDNYDDRSSHYYISQVEHIGNPIFKNELAFGSSYYLNIGLRLLALYRYWNSIQYFFPYRHLIKEDWNEVLVEFIPKFVQASIRSEYVLACLELTGRIQDTHAYFQDQIGTLDSLKGMLIIPFKTKFIERKLLVTGYYKDSAEIKPLLKVGDIIEGIDGIKTDSLVEQLLKFTPGSNRDAQLEQLSSNKGFLLRSNNPDVKLLTRSKGKLTEHVIKRIPVRSTYTSSNANVIDRGYKKLNGDIGYIYPASLKESDIESIKPLFKNTKGLIIDLRCYPSTFMPFTYGSWLKQTSSPFVHFTSISLKMPGAIVHRKNISNGTFCNNDFYKGKVIILVNASTISQAEYTTMALSTVQGSLVLGSTTAGADGDISEITLPGGIKTSISGTGVYYPDGTETQQTGVKIDISLRPTIEGIRSGRDEVLEKAMDLISEK